MMKISIIMPTLNVEETVSEAVQSAIKQRDERVELEFVVADGGSKDNTREIVESFDGVRLLKGDDNGLYDGLNRGLDSISGSHILFLNADDILPDGTISAYCNVLEQNPDIDLVTGNGEVVGDQKADLIPKSRLNLQSALFAIPAINARLYSRELFKKVRFDIDCGMSSDRLMLYSLALREIRSIYLDRLVYVYRSHKKSMSFAVDPVGRSNVRLAELRAANILSQKYPDDSNVKGFEMLQYLKQSLYASLRTPPNLGPTLRLLPFLPYAIRSWLKHRNTMSGW